MPSSGLRTILENFASHQGGVALELKLLLVEAVGEFARLSDRETALEAWATSEGFVPPTTTETNNGSSEQE